MKSERSFSVVSKSAITPSFRGLIATISPGVRPIISLAAIPTAKTFLEDTSNATTEGSFNTIPSPLTNTKVLAVPKSIPISLDIKSKKPIPPPKGKFSNLTPVYQPHLPEVAYRLFLLLNIYIGEEKADKLPQVDAAGKQESN